MTRAGALSGLKVLDLGRVLAAPWATQILADLGADIIKLEHPEGGDDSRNYGAAARTRDGVETPAPMFLFANRNKRSVTVDFSQPEGREIVVELARASDVLVENFIPGALKRYELDYASMREINPQIIYCSVSGYGLSGPYASRPGYDAVFQAIGGLMAVTGLPDGVPGGGPMKTGPSLVDVATGYSAATAIMAALVHRAKTGEGQQIDVSLLDTVLTLQSSLLQGFLITGEQPKRKGTEGNGGHPARVYACRDGDIYISAGHQGHYRGLCQVLGLEALIYDARFTSHRLRTANRGQWNEVAEPVIKQWARAELLARLVEAGVPSALVNDYAAVFADEHVQHRGVTVAMPNPINRTHRIEYLASPVRLSATPVQYDMPPPLLGEHTDEVLAERLGYDATKIRDLRQRGVV